MSNVISSSSPPVVNLESAVHSAPVFNPESLHFIPLGGSGEIGMNANFYGYNNTWIMVDCGVMFSRNPDGILMPDLTDFLKVIDQKPKGLFLTHAHEDHFGAVAPLWSLLKCPIYCTPFTAFLLREKLKEARVSAPIIEVPVGGNIQLECFNVKFVPITHSIPESNLLLIQTPKGNIVHTGDWKLDPDPLLGERTDLDELKRIGDQGVLVMVCDSTNVFEKGHSGSESEVKKNLAEAMESLTTGVVVVSCFASNAARVKSIYEVARAYGRQVLLLGRSLLRIKEAATATGYFDKEMEFLTPEQSKLIPRDRLMVICTGSQAEPAAALTRMGYGEHPALALGEHDTVFLSSRVIPGNEESISSLINHLTRLGVKIIQGPHVSGHGYEEELTTVYNLVRPHISIPVHGEDRHIYQHALLAESLGVPVSITPHNGDIYTLAPDISYIGTVKTQRLYLDGKRLIPAQGAVMSQRQEMLHQGIVLIVVTASRATQKILSRNLTSYGLWATPREEQQWQGRLLGALSKCLPETLESSEATILPGTINRHLQSYLYNTLGKRPVIKVHIQWVHQTKSATASKRRGKTRISKEIKAPSSSTDEL